MRKRGWMRAMCLLVAVKLAVAVTVFGATGDIADTQGAAWLLTAGELAPGGEASVFTLSVCLVPDAGGQRKGPGGQPGALLFSVTWPEGWKLLAAEPGRGTQTATVTVTSAYQEGDAAGKGTPENSSGCRILIDGPMQLEDGGELAVLTLQIPTQDQGNTAGSPVTVRPGADSPYIYYFEENQIMTAIPLAGSTRYLHTQPETAPAESGGEDTPGTPGAENTQGAQSAQSAPPDAQTDSPAGVVYVGCQETACEADGFSVRFLFLVPADRAGQESGAVWVSGGGEVTLTVSTASAVTAADVTATRQGGQTVIEPEEGYLFCVLTYSGLDPGGRYIFTVDTGQGMIEILYAEGTYGGVISRP